MIYNLYIFNNFQYSGDLKNNRLQITVPDYLGK